MKRAGNKGALYFIGSVIVITLSIQVYWNILNYQANKATLSNEVLAALDNSIDAYYTNLAKDQLKNKVSTSISINGSSITTSTLTQENMRSMMEQAMAETKKHFPMSASDSLRVFHFDTTVFDTSRHSGTIKNIIIRDSVISNSMISPDSLDKINDIASKVVMSLFRKDADLQVLSGYLNDELSRKGIQFQYALQQQRRQHVLNTLNDPEAPIFKLSVTSRSAYLSEGSSITLYFPDMTLLVLKKGITVIALSLMVLLGIIGALIYLLNIIRRQEQSLLSKNDFISNISHELKTPIATSMSAIEGLTHFNAIADKEKTDKYLFIAGDQLKKLQGMVEKIMDTISVDSDQLLLQKEELDVAALIQQVIDKQQITTSKPITFQGSKPGQMLRADVFHLENVFNNMIENAIKYGGDAILILLQDHASGLEIRISDSGKAIDKSQREKIFQKFYRIPTHNRHDVKGYGIGLYYARQIVEKHGGTLELLNDTKTTTFQIFLPYGR